MTGDDTLPPGQRGIADFPRFGATPFARRFPRETERIALALGGDVRTSVVIREEELARLERVEQVSDFHCVTTWSRRALRWSGFRFSELYARVIVPLAGPVDGATFVVLHAQDGYRTSMALEDLMADDVLIADRLEGEPLSIAHGAPLRVVAPAHYGYKSVKHVDRIELYRDGRHFRSVGPAFMIHPRARVSLEERGRWIPGWVLRRLYAPLIASTRRAFERGLRDHLSHLRTR